jgi:hypothetical protein
MSLEDFEARVSLVKIQLMWNHHKDGIKICNISLEKMQDPSEYCTGIYEMIHKHEAGMRKILETHQECKRCGKLTLRPEECKCGK